jgi:hypothetical protein
MQEYYRQPPKVARLLILKLSSFQSKSAFDQRKHWEKFIPQKRFFRKRDTLLSTPNPTEAHAVAYSPTQSS